MQPDTHNPAFVLLPCPVASPCERLVSELSALRRSIAELCDQLRHVSAPSAGRAGGAGVAARPETPAPLYARYFGRFALFRGEEPLPLGQNSSVVQLCCYLAARVGILVPRDELIELLWPEAEPQRAIHRLHVAVSALRGLLDSAGAPTSVVQCENERYAIAAGCLVTDAALFDAHYQQGRHCLAQRDADGAVAAFVAALALYQGDYLADTPYVEWSHLPRAHFAERRMNALVVLCELAAQASELGTVIDYAQQILELDQLRERAHRHLMRTHYALGQRACALRQYEACARLLQTELGVRPSQLTERLYQAIRDDTELPAEVAIRL